MSRSSTPSNIYPSGAYDPYDPSSSSSSSSAIGVTRSRTLLFLSFRESAPRPSGRRKKPRLSSTNDDDDPLGAGASTNRGTYFDSSGHLSRKYSDTGDDPYHDDAAANDDTDTSHLITRDSHAISIPSLPPKWVDVSDQIDQILTDLTPKMSKLDRLHNKHLLPGFVDRTSEERDIEVLSNEITREFRRASKLIAALATDMEKSKRSGTASMHEISLAQNVQTALAQRVQAISGQFRKKQSNYMQRLKGQDVRHREVLGELGLAKNKLAPAVHQQQQQGAAALRDEELAVREDVEMSRQQLQSSSQSQLLLFDSEQQQSHDNNDALINQRSTEINQIAKSIIELSELFQDLNALVIDQGTLLDRIDYNIETMGQNIQQANTELNAAVKSQKRSGKGMCVLFLLLCCALLITIILTKPFFR